MGYKVTAKIGDPEVIEKLIQKHYNTAAESITDIIGDLQSDDALKELAKVAPQGTPQAAPKSKETKGRETLTVNGKKLDCEWVQHVDEDGSVSKVWFCDGVPGRTVKVEAKRPGSTGTTLVVEWKGTKK